MSCRTHEFRAKPLALQSTKGPNARCWVWFRNGLNVAGGWRGGWYGAESVIGGIRIEHPDYVPCRVPEWRVSFKEPDDKSAAPDAPEGELWKLVPTDPRK